MILNDIQKKKQSYAIQIIQIDQLYVQTMFSIYKKAKHIFKSVEMINLFKILFQGTFVKIYKLIFSILKNANCDPKKAGTVGGFICIDKDFKI